jgi:hypothetical protein
MVRDRGVLYVGGTFLSIDGRPRHYLAAFDVRSGSLLPWDPDAGNVVTCLAAGWGLIYAGGYFDRIGSTSRLRLAAIDPVSGKATSWNPEADDEVKTLALKGRTVFVGGFFRYLGGAARPALGAVDIQTGHATEWDPQVVTPRGHTANINKIAVAGSTVYVAGGSFFAIGGREQLTVAALDIKTGKATEWAPAIPMYAGYWPQEGTSIAIHGNVVYISGTFGEVNGQPRASFAALNARTGVLLGWNPRASGGGGITLQGRDAYLFGSFTVMWNWVPRRELAAFDANTGEVRPWDPNPNGDLIGALAVGEGVVYVSGGFSNVGGQPRMYLAAVDTATGQATTWDPGVNADALTLLVADGRLYAGGYFTQAGAEPRGYLAAWDTRSGALLDWNPAARSHVYCLKQAGNTLLVGGFFGAIGGQIQRGLAAFDMTNGALKPWQGVVDDGWVSAMVIDGQRLYVGGAFSYIGGRHYESLAALDLETGAPLEWSPDLRSGNVYTPMVDGLALCGPYLCAGGDFSTPGGQRYFALFDTTTAAVFPWNANVDGIVWTLAGFGDTVYAGGGFTHFGVLPAAGFASFTLDGRRPAVASLPSAWEGGPLLALAAANPVSSEALIRFSLPAPAPVDLAIFDVEGRRVAEPLRGTLKPSGSHQVTLQTSGWPAGCYFCRLRAGGASATRKFIVVR